jgi:MFS family permease
MTGLILYRGLQGLGAGGLMVLAQTAVADLVPPRRRGRYQGLFTGVFALCSVAGPVLGGMITDALSWRWIFYVNLPVGAVALSLILVALPRSKRPRVAHRIDYLGAVLLTTMTAALLLLLSWGGTVAAWSSPTIVGFALGAAALFVLLLTRERVAAEPILPLPLFSNRVFAIAIGVVAVTAMALFGGARSTAMWRARSAHRNPSFGRSCASGPLSAVAKASPRGWRSKAAEPEFVGLADGKSWIRTVGS